MTQGTRKRLAKAVTIMSQAIKPKWIANPVDGRTMFHRFSFITLTVANAKNITGREAYDKLFNHFLDWLTRTAFDHRTKLQGCKTYIWKAELQKRGQIHYHITTPAFLHYKDIRKKWNELQRKAGLLDEYAKEHKHFDPNSTDIHNTQNVKHADRYILKELGKTISALQLEAAWEVKEKVKTGELEPELAEEQIKAIYEQKICTVGKIWGCSEDLAGIGYFTLDLTRSHENIIDQWIAEGKARKVVDDYFAIVYCDNVDPPDILSSLERSGFRNYLEHVLNRNFQQN